MAYKAYLNNQLFFDSSLQNESFFLSYAVLELEANTAGDFSFRIPPSNDYYDSFHRLTDYVDVYRDDDLIFSGRVYSITEETDTQRLISCEGLLALLNDSIYRPYTFDGTLRNLVRNILDSHNSQVESDKQITAGILTIEDADVYRAYQNYETSISRLKDLVASFGGYISVTKQNSALSLNWTPDFTEGCDQVVMLNSNLIRITKEENSDGIITVLVPVGATKDDGSLTTIASVNSGLDYIVASQEYLDQYGYVVGTHRWQDVNVPQILKTKAQKYLTASLQPRTTIELTAADLADAGYDLDAFRVGQKVTVKSDPHGIDYVQFNCQEQRLDLLRPESNFLTLGEVKEGYVQVNSRNSLDSIVTELSSQFASRSMLQLAIQSATQLITGNSGGYVVLHDSDNDTYPDEILIMDTPDISTAVKVWRWNNSGLGYSSTGYNGTYGLAMTMDGQIVADFITTGTLNADRIRAGVIRGQQGNTYWDLNTGVLHIEGSGDIDKSKTFIYQPVPPYYVGDLWCTQRSETSGVVGYAIAGYAIVGDESDGEGGKIMACIYTRTSGSFNPDDWTLITNYIDDSDLQILQQRISSAEINIDANAAEIQTKASVEIVDNLGNRLASAETTIEQNSHDITLKATESDITGNYVIGKINLNSTTATIAASHIDLQGAVTISSFDSATQSKVVIGSTSRNQYYLSTSSSSATGGSWSDTVPTWGSGKYVWVRIATTKTYADNTTGTSYSTAVYDSNLTTALSTATSANTTARGALANTVSVYYRGTSSTAPSISTSTSIGTSDNTDNAWEYVLPRPKNGRYFFTCERYTDRAGNVTFSAVRQMSNLTVSSLWCSANDSTYIDGGHIYASSVTATQIASSAITADKISVGAVTNAKLGDGAVTSGKIGSGAIIETKLADSAVTTNKINSSAVTSGKLADNAVTTAKINASAVTNAKLADGAVTAGKIGSGAVTEVKLADGSVTVDKVGSNAITSVKLADGSVTTAKVPSYAITGVKIADNAIVARCIAANAVTANAIAAGAITADKIDVTDLSALGATIGGFAIDSTTLHTNGKDVTDNSTGSIGISSNALGFTRNLYSYSSGGSGTISVQNLMLAIGSGFGVDNTGYITANGIRCSNVSCLTGNFANGNFGRFTVASTGGGANNSLKAISSNERNEVQVICPETYSSYAFYIAGTASGTSRSRTYSVTTSGNIYAQQGYFETTVSAQTVTQRSDRKLKTDISLLDESESLKFIRGLDAFSYRFKSDPAKIHHGFMADDIAKVVSDSWGIVTDVDMYEDGVRKETHKELGYTEIIADLVVMVKYLDKKVKMLEES